MSANKNKNTKRDVIIAHSGDYAAIEVVRHFGARVLFEVYCCPEDDVDEPIEQARQVLYKSLLARDLAMTPTILVDDTGRAADPREVNTIHKTLYQLVQKAPPIVDFVLMGDCAAIFESVVSIVDGIRGERMYVITWINNGRMASAYAAPLKRLYEKAPAQIVNVFTESHSCGLDHHLWVVNTRKPCLCELALSRSNILMKNKSLVAYAEIYNETTMRRVIETLCDFEPSIKEIAERLDVAYKRCADNKFSSKDDRAILGKILDEALHACDPTTVGTETYRDLMHCEKIARVDPLILPIDNLAALPIEKGATEHVNKTRTYLHCKLGACLPATVQKDSSMSMLINHCYAPIPEKFVDYLQSLAGM